METSKCTRTDRIHAAGWRARMSKAQAQRRPRLTGTAGFQHPASVVASISQGGPMQTSIHGLRAIALAVLSMAILTSACSSSGGSEWTISNDVDAMTDVSVSKAVSTLPGANFNLEATIACGSGGKLAYQFRTFDKSGEPANLKVDDIHGSFGKIAVIRIDDGKPYSHWDFSRFANQVLITGREASEMAEGSKLVLRLRLMNGDETYTLDQSGASVRSVFQNCLPAKASTVPVPPSSSEAGPAEGAIADNSSQTQMSGVSKAECWTPPSGPTIDDDPDRPITADEVQEIEKATGRAYVQGDSIYGRAEDRCST